MAKNKRDHYRKWTAEEFALLKELYPECPIGEIAKRLDRTVPAVKVRAYSLGLKRKSYLDKLWSPHELELLMKLYPHCKCTRDVAKEIGRPLTAVRQKAYDLGIKMEKKQVFSKSDRYLI